jgi:hypothetical protein
VLTSDRRGLSEEEQRLVQQVSGGGLPIEAGFALLATLRDAIREEMCARGNEGATSDADPDLDERNSEAPAGA